MQQFEAKLENVPMGAPQAYSSTSTSLNKEETLSEASKVLTSNNLDVDLLQHKGGAREFPPLLMYLINGVVR